MKVPKISMIPLCLPTNHFSPNPLIVFTWIPKGHGQFGTFLWLNLPWLINAKTQKKLLTWITNSQTPWIVQGQTERFFFSLILRNDLFLTFLLILNLPTNHLSIDSRSISTYLYFLCVGSISRYCLFVYLVAG